MEQEKSIDYEKIGEQIRKLRIQKGISQSWHGRLKYRRRT